jgi:NAD(P)-dependent dehydrogenase (short-subunit alcohol dehydrogenase family)
MSRTPSTGAKTMSKHQGKVAVITGGTSGIGLASAQRLAAEGAYVFITGRRAPELDAAAKAIGKNVTAVQGDVSRMADLDHLYEVVKREKGRIDILFANAGVAKQAKLGTITEEQFDREFGTNVKGALFTVQKALPLLVDGGSIILNASIVASKGFPALSVYSATKAALRSFARTWTTDLKDRRIRVNVVSPGPIDTPGLQGLNSATSEQLTAALADTIPVGRTGRPDDVAKAVSFLASDESSFITGAELFVDGGIAQV